MHAATRPCGEAVGRWSPTNGVGPTRPWRPAPVARTLPVVEPYATGVPNNVVIAPRLFTLIVLSGLPVLSLNMSWLHPGEDGVARAQPVDIDTGHSGIRHPPHLVEQRRRHVHRIGIGVGIVVPTVVAEELEHPLVAVERVDLGRGKRRARASQSNPSPQQMSTMTAPSAAGGMTLQNPQRGGERRAGGRGAERQRAAARGAGAREPVNLSGKGKRWHGLGTRREKSSCRVTRAGCRHHVSAGAARSPFRP